MPPLGFLMKINESKIIYLDFCLQNYDRYLDFVGA